MARIPEEELARLKAEADLVGLVRASGVILSPCGADFRGRCPFHEGDNDPSLVVTPAKGLYHCFGCDAGGDALTWLQKTQGISFRHAVEVLRAEGVRLDVGARPVKSSKVRHIPPPVALDAGGQRLLNQVVDFYHATLRQTTEGLAYLEKRGLRSSEMIDRFKLGYANRTLGYRLPARSLRSEEDLRGRLIEVGILRESGHEAMAGCLVVPILDEVGNVLSVYGRRIADAMRAGTKHLYLKGPHRGVWNVDALSASKEIALCESLLDAMTFWAHGHRAVTTSYGVQGFTDELLAAMKRHGTERVFIAYDGDEAGDVAAEALAPRLAEAGMEVLRVVFPRGMDANEYAREVASPAEGLGELLRTARLVRKAARTSVTPSVDPPSSSPPEPLEPAKREAAAPPPPEAAAPPFTEAGAPPFPEAPSPSPPAVEGLGAASGPAAPSVRVIGEEVEMTVGDRAYRVRDLWKNLSLGRMEVNVRISRGETYHVDTFDLLKARPRELYIKQAALELSVEAEVVKKDLGKLLDELEVLQARRVKKVLTPKPRNVEVPEAEKEAAFALLRDPRLLARIVEDFDRIGLVGEETNKLVGYLAAVSRKMEDPLAVLVQSNSAAGKSALMDAVLELCPEEDVERYTAMTGQSLYYMADVDLKHRILAIAEVAGAEKAGYAIKTLQSDGRISIATTVKDPETGEMRTKKHEVEGPVAIMLTTTEAEIDEELQNRAVVLTVNEDREQTRAIHEAQRRAETLEGMLARRERRAVIRLHRNAQRLLRPMLVVNPFAVGLTFLDTKLRTRRDHAKYLTLIRAVALLHQYQRPIHHTTHEGQVVPYVEVTLSDIVAAHRLANEVLGRSLDELAPQTRRLLRLLEEMVRERCAARKVAREDLRFTRREVREYAAWSEKTVRKHLDRLVELEHVLPHRGTRGQSFVYELVYDGKGKEGERFMVGLVDPKTLGGAAASGEAERRTIGSSSTWTPTSST